MGQNGLSRRLDAADWRPRPVVHAAIGRARPRPARTPLHVLESDRVRGVPRDACAPGHVALDVGANVGAYAALLGQWVGATGRVYAFEPSPAAFRGLVRHIALNAQDGVVTPVAAAVADREGTGDLIVADTAGESRLADGVERGRTISVAIVTIDSFCAREGLLPVVHQDRRGRRGAGGASGCA